MNLQGRKIDIRLINLDTQSYKVSLSQTALEPGMRMRLQCNMEHIHDYLLGTASLDTFGPQRCEENGHCFQMVHRHASVSSRELRTPSLYN